MLIAYGVIVDRNTKNINIARKFGIDGFICEETSSGEMGLPHSLTSIQGAMLLCSEPA